MKAWALVVCLLACGVALWGCVHKVGDPCYTGDSFCADGGVCLTCQQSKLAPYLCGGAKGCHEDGSRNITCDQSANAAAGGLCFSEYEGKAQCRNDGTGYLTCTQGVWTATSCPSSTTCKDIGGVACQ